MNKENKERARTYVSSIREGSSTNLCGGLLKGRLWFHNPHTDECFDSF